MTDPCPHGSVAEDCLACMDNATDDYIRRLQRNYEELVRWQLEAVPLLKEWEKLAQPHPTSIRGQLYKRLIKLAEDEV